MRNPCPFDRLAVQHVVPAAPRPYDEIRSEIARKVFDAALEQAIAAYGDKLRSLSDVKVFLR